MQSFSFCLLRHMSFLADKIRAKLFLGIGIRNACFFACFKATHHPNHIFGKVAHRLHALGVLRDRGYGSAVDDGREQPDLVVELIGLFFEFRELVVYLVDPFPQGGVVEVVAASAAEKKSRCQK